MKFDFDQYIEASRLSSMDYWWPLTKDLPVPQPRTEAILTMGTDKWIDFLDNPNILNNEIKKLQSCADKLGYPLFIRTDQSSAKHSYVSTCKVEDKCKIGVNTLTLIEENLMYDLNVQTLYFREFIELNSLFTAFNKMPVAPERRYFVKDGKVICHHPYWVLDAIRNPSHIDWVERLSTVNFEDPCEIEVLTRYAQIIGSKFTGCWSIDFAQARDGTWYFIDMADARVSWHPESCEFYKEMSLEQTEPKPVCNIELVKKEDKATEDNI